MNEDALHNLEQRYAAAGFTVHDAVRAFLREHHGREVAHRNKAGRYVTTLVDPVAAMEVCTSEEAIGLSKLAGDSLLPVGPAVDEHLTLFVGAKGDLYVGAQGLLFRFKGVQSGMLEDDLDLSKLWEEIPKTSHMRR